MWAYKVEAPSRLQRVDVPAPSAKDMRPGDVIIRLEAAGICGSDIPKFHGRVSASDPVIGFPLHELCGEVVESAHPELRAGMRVVGMARGSNGFSEYVLNPGDMFRAVDSPLSPALISVIQPVATVMNALAMVPDPAGKRVAVIGQGPLGMLFSHIMKWRGASHVTGVDRIDRSDLGPVFGVDRVVTRSSDGWARDLADDERPDICIEAVGHQPSTLNDAITATAQFGTVFGFGVPDDTHYAIPFERIFRKRLTLVGGYTTDYRRFLAEAEEYLLANPQQHHAYITDLFPFDRAQEAFERYARPTPGRLKVVLEARW